ncbi:MAG: c-type cytochrome [Nitrospiraceae bacterium]
MFRIRPPLAERARATLVVAGVVAILATFILWFDSSRSPRRIPVRVPEVLPSMVPLVTGDEPIGELFVRAGCPVCHTIPGIQGAEGRVGPKLALGTAGSTRLSDSRYSGQASTVREYIIESILDPRVYVVEGYPDKVMPNWYGKKLSAQALEKIASYLESFTEDAPHPDPETRKGPDS